MDDPGHESHRLVRTFSRESDIKHVKHQQIIGNSFFQKLKEHKDRRSFCDVILKVRGENTNIWAHKIILASFSGYFGGMFNPASNMKEKELDEIPLELPGFSSDIFKQIINYGYSSEIIITVENVEKLTIAARFLEVTHLLEECEEFLKANLQGDNCLGMLVFAKNNNLRNLQGAALHFAQTNFEAVYLSREIGALDLETFAELLNSGSLLIKHGFITNGEELVLEMVRSYIQKKTDIRTEDVTAILRLVKLPYLKEETLQSLLRCEMLENIQKCKELIDGALKYQKKECETPMEKHWETKRRFAGIYMFNSAL